MSRSVDLFVDPAVDTHQLLVMLGHIAHAAAVETADGRWQVRFDDRLVAHAYRHPYIDDGDLHLSRYPWVVSIRVGHEGSLVDHPATTALRMVADDLRSHRCKVLLVLDLQYRLDLGPDPAEADSRGADSRGADSRRADSRGVDSRGVDSSEADGTEADSSEAEAGGLTAGLEPAGAGTGPEPGDLRTAEPGGGGQ